ncbi:MAG TPA: hypothetical protein VMZ28_26595 [Kofleriaceae bacterium]|nr:hypothetical protein [Kofleriaceae bacterium]
MRALVALWVVAAAGTASAQPADWLRLEAPTGCPGPDVVARRVADLAAEGAATPEPAVVRVTSQGGGGWSATVVIEGRPGERQLAGATCAEVVEAAAFLIALGLEEAPAPPPRTETPPTPARSDGADARRILSAPPEPPASRRGLGGAFRAGVAGDSGSLPRASGGGQLGISVRRGALSVEVDGRYLIARPAYVADTDAGADIGLWTVAGRGCYGARPGAWLCAGAEAGRMEARGLALRVTRSGGALYAAGLVSGRLDRHLTSNLAILLAAEVALAVSRPEFLLDEGVPLYRPGPAAARAMIGVEVDLF